MAEIDACLTRMPPEGTRASGRVGFVNRSCRRRIGPSKMITLREIDLTGTRLENRRHPVIIVIEDARIRGRHRYGFGWLNR